MSDGAVEARRGQPVLFLGMLLIGWLLIRAISWQTPWPVMSQPTKSKALAFSYEAERTSAPASKARPLPLHDQTVPPDGGRVPNPALSSKQMPIFVRLTGRDHRADLGTGERMLGESLSRQTEVAELPLPGSTAKSIDRKLAAAPPSDADWLKAWRIDAWLMLRGGGTPALAGGARPASYGASQTGAVFAYRLAQSSRHEPAIYSRASKALVTEGETEAALGMRAKPVGGLPVTMHAELRATEFAGQVQLRPAAFVSAGIDDERMPLGLEASGYAQAGYVAGDFATAFADGRVDLTRDIKDNDFMSLSGGAGAWGGAQRGAKRVDIGPTLKLDFGLGDGQARLAADIRFRVAGNAEPSSGAALTLSAGF
ncbi:hypothetical protein Q9K02_04865 [Qipengyuania sp. G39]|uniref:Autotransporter domain-containing protein n=1 Tax=Qipengyuania profundimaris TaxID=3067652 RepID=A0ABT9HMT6_9SPHN|nr:hypothetical protein [Qipengyuania sp. G39]MDP4574467.1 hypothetical protein [Qipengyuania sp. G39]